MHQGWRHAEPDQTGRCRFTTGDPFLHSKHRIFGLFRRAQQFVAGLRAFQPIGPSQKQPGIEPAFQGLQTPAHSGVVDTEHACSATQRSGTGQRQEDPYIIPVNGSFSHHHDAISISYG